MAVNRLHILRNILFILSVTASLSIQYSANNAIAYGGPSYGIYRIPYQTGKNVTVTAAHETHGGNMDFDASVGLGELHRIVAAADGIVKYVYDENTLQETPPCSLFQNNYVWIEHANGEWTGYFHLEYHSATVDAGLTVGETVVAGQYIGNEGSVGCSTGPHLHFTISIPQYDNPINAGGSINDNANNKRDRPAKFCQVGGGHLVQGQTYTVPFLSSGTYRIPYQNGTTVQVNSDHLTHVPKNKIDLGGTAGAVGGEYRIVAAAAGTVRYIRDNFSTQNAPGTNPCNDNYLWIEHSYGEWTGYFHMKQNSSTVAAGLTVGAKVAAGQFLGNQGSVGCSTGSHLHFEVATPKLGINTTTGLPNNNPDGNHWNVVPRVIQLNNGVFVAGQSYIAE